jgi:hypothetical protein
MKISKTALLVLGIGIFILGFAILFVLYSGQAGEQALLNDNLAASQNLLPKLLAEKSELEDQLAQWDGELAKATAELDKSEARYPKSVESIEYDEVLFKLAEDCDLRIVELTASEPSSENVKDTDIIYDITTVSVVVQDEESPPSNAGDYEIYIDAMVDKALNFIHLIVNTPDFDVATVTLASMENLEPPEEVDGSEEIPEATIELAIYAFPR